MSNIDSSLVLKSPLEMAIENIKTKTARMFSKEPEPSGDVIAVELESVEDDDKIVKNIINISNIKNINDFTKTFVEELQLQSEQKEQALREYLQNIIEEYFIVKEPDIQQYLEQKFEKVVNDITNVDRTTVEYQKEIQSVIERVLQNAETVKVFEHDVIERLEQVAPEIVHNELTKIINKAQNVNNTTVKKENSLQTTVNELQKTFITQNVNSIENIAPTVNPQTVEIVKAPEKGKLDTVNKELIEEIPSSTGSMSIPLMDSVSSLPSLDLPSSNETNSSSPSSAGAGSPSRPVVSVTTPEAHTEFYGYPGFIGISELA